MPGLASMAAMGLLSLAVPQPPSVEADYFRGLWFGFFELPAASLLALLVGVPLIILRVFGPASRRALLLVLVAGIGAEWVVVLEFAGVLPLVTRPDVVILLGGILPSLLCALFAPWLPRNGDSSGPSSSLKLS